LATGSRPELRSRPAGSRPDRVVTQNKIRVATGARVATPEKSGSRPDLGRDRGSGRPTRSITPNTSSSHTDSKRYRYVICFGKTPAGFEIFTLSFLRNGYRFFKTVFWSDIALTQATTQYIFFFFFQPEHPKFYRKIKRRFSGF